MRWPCVCLLSCLASAQVFVVDASNGPGTSFTSIAAAVAAVPDGAVLQVRAGTYAGFAIQSKSLAVLGDPGVLVGDLQLPPISVDAVAAGQTVVLRGLGISNALGAATIWCTNSPGTILIDACRGDPSTSMFGGGVLASACGELHVRNCTFHPPPNGVSCLALSQCNTAVLACSLSSPFGWPILLTGGTLDLAASDVLAGFVGPAIMMNGGQLDVRGGSRLSGSGFPPPALAIDGTGQVRLDPNTVIQNAPNPAFGAGLNVTPVALPWLATWPGTPGGNASASLFGPGGGAGGIGALLVGFPGPPYVPSGLTDRSWIRPGTEIVNAIGAATLAGGYAVPNAPWVLGVTLCWQGAVWSAAGGLQLSNPAPYAHH